MKVRPPLSRTPMGAAAANGYGRCREVPLAQWIRGVALAAVFAGCDPTTSGTDTDAGGGLAAGATCEATSQCEAGLECLPFSVFQGDTCEDVGLMCTTGCNVTDDCAPLGSNYQCFATCDAGETCGPTG